MTINISQYTASIGTFSFEYKKNHKYKREISYKESSIFKGEFSYKNHSTFRLGISYKFLKTLFIFLFINYAVFNENGKGCKEVSENNRVLSLNLIKYSSRSELRCQYYHYSNISNFQSKYTYGNKGLKGIRICHWNKSNSSIQSKLPDIKNLISRERPHLFGISEANVKCNLDIDTIKISDYTLYLAPPSSNGMIRLIVYIHKSMVVKLRTDLMDNELSSLWFEAGLKNKNKILINQFYRE